LHPGGRPSCACSSSSSRTGCWRSTPRRAEGIPPSIARLPRPPEAPPRCPERRRTGVETPAPRAEGRGPTLETRDAPLRDAKERFETIGTRVEKRDGPVETLREWLETLGTLMETLRDTFEIRKTRIETRETLLKTLETLPETQGKKLETLEMRFETPET